MQFSKKSTRFARLVLVLMSAALGGSLAPAQTPEGEDPIVSVNMKDALLEDLVQMLAEASNADFLIVPGVEAQKITLKVTDTPLSEILDLISEVYGSVYGFTIEKRKAGLYVVRPVAEKDRATVTVVQASTEQEPDVTVEPVRPPTEKEKPEPAPVIPPATPPLPRVVAPPVDQLPGEAVGAVFEEEETTWHEIELKYRRASEVARMLGGFAVYDENQLGRAMYGGNPIRGRQSRGADRAQPNTFDLIAPRDQFGGGGFGGGGFGGGGFGGGGFGGGGFGGGGRGGGGFGGGGFGGGGFGGGFGGGGFIAPEGIDAIIGYDLINRLIVRGTATAVADLERLIKIIDRPPKQIEIEARYVTIKTQDQRGSGLDWALTNDEAQVSQTGFVVGGDLTYRYAVGNFNALWSALNRRVRGKVINAPKIVMQNGQLAYLMVGTSTWIISNEIERNQFGIQTITQVPEEYQVGSGLMVLAYITGEPPYESVTISMTPFVSDITGSITTSEGEVLPITSFQDIFTQVRVEDGQTIAMGGLVRRRENVGDQRVPILGQIPIIGDLFFKKKDRTFEDEELVIFVTPRIIRDRAFAEDMGIPIEPAVAPSPYGR